MDVGVFFNYLISADDELHAVAEEEEDDDHDQAEAGLGVPLLLDAQPGPVLPDQLEPPPDQRVERPQRHHGDEQADQERADQVVAQEVACMAGRREKKEGLVLGIIFCPFCV